MKDGIESLGRIRAQGIAILLVTFLVGVIAGFAGERVRASRAAARTPLDLGPRMMRPFREGRLPLLFDQLDLTAEQREKIRDIMERRRPRTDELLREMLPRLRAVTDSLEAEVRAVLTAEQAVRLDSLVVKTRRGRRGPRSGRRERFRSPPPPQLF